MEETSTGSVIVHTHVTPRADSNDFKSLKSFYATKCGIFSANQYTAVLRRQTDFHDVQNVGSTCGYAVSDGVM